MKSILGEVFVVEKLTSGAIRIDLIGGYGKKSSNHIVTTDLLINPHVNKSSRRPLHNGFNGLYDLRKELQISPYLMTNNFTQWAKMRTKENYEEECIRETQRQIEQLRIALREISPEQFHGVLSSYTVCESENASRQWEDNVAMEIIQKTTPIVKTPDSDYYGHRAYCPLCGGGRNAYELPGYAYPEGLRRHLLGWGTARRCTVFETAYKLAGNYWWLRFTKSQLPASDPGKL